MKTIKMFFFFAIVFTIASCSTSTRTTSSWKSPDIANDYLSGKKILVAAMLPEKDRELQKNMEKRIVDELSAKGVQAISGFEKFEPKYFPEDEAKSLEKLNNSDIDAVITVVLLDTDKQKSYTPGRVSVRPVGYYRSWYGYYQTVYSRIYTHGYYTSNTSMYWESNLYDLDGNKLLYSAQSESFDPTSISQLAIDYSKRLIEDMGKQGLVVVK